MPRRDDQGSPASQTEDKDAVDPTADDSDSEYGDSDILNEAEEQEKLLTPPPRFDAITEAFRKRDERRQRRSRAPASHNGQVMFEMENGYKDSSSQSSVELDWDKSSKESKSNRRFSMPMQALLLSLLSLLVGLLFVTLAWGAWRASGSHNSGATPLQTLWNGTHFFKPTTILISLDGFRADFLNRNLTPALNAFIDSGVSPPYMLPSFPSVTFPNHFTLVTGLYPESHGIVGNQFWDPELQEEFYYTDTQTSMQPKWWTAEPVWATAEKQGVRTAVHMWPGSEAHISHVEPTYLDRFNASEVLPKKIDRLLHWLDLEEERPQLLLAYVPNVDSDGHLYGPNSTEIRATIADVDSMLTLLVEGLLTRNLTEIVNLVIVSDHGMATTSTSRLIQLDDIIDLSLVDHIDGWPLRGLRLKNATRDLDFLHSQLLLEANKTGTFDVYTRETMPARYHFSNNDRIAPLWVVPKTGYAVVEEKDFSAAEALSTGQEYHPKGLHGYDHEHPLMRAIFVARGPAFPHPPNSRVAVFQNIQVYNIICDSVGLQSHANNGTLRLPLTPDGLHPDGPKVENVYDAGEHESASPGQKDGHDADVSEENKEEGDEKPAWWSFLHEQLQKAKDWAKHLVESLTNNKQDATD
ncbi:hypothetical protein DV735_g2649, partial [Chaetothyriales sp. CBS 134920]